MDRATQDTNRPQDKRPIHINLYPVTDSVQFQAKHLVFSPGQEIRVGRVSGSRNQREAKPENGVFTCEVMSREHALLKEIDGKICIKDCHSTHGTFVNNERVLDEFRPLNHNDQITFGHSVKRNQNLYMHLCALVSFPSPAKQDEKHQAAAERSESAQDQRAAPNGTNTNHAEGRGSAPAPKTSKKAEANPQAPVTPATTPAIHKTVPESRVQDSNEADVAAESTSAAEAQSGVPEPAEDQAPLDKDGKDEEDSLAPEVPKQTVNAYDDYEDDAADVGGRDTKDARIDVGLSQSRTVGKDAVAKAKDHAQKSKESAKKEPAGRQTGKTRAPRGRGRHAVATRAKQEVVTRRQEVPTVKGKDSPPRQKEASSQAKEEPSIVVTLPEESPASSSQPSRDIRVVVNKKRTHEEMDEREELERKVADAEIRVKRARQSEYSWGGVGFVFGLAAAVSYFSGFGA